MVQSFSTGLMSPCASRPAVSTQVSVSRLSISSSVNATRIAVTPALTKNVLAAFVAVLILAIGIMIGRHFAAVAAIPAVAPLTIHVTVAPGDTLWTLSQRYGNANVNIQDRIDTLAQANEMSAGSPLISGQRLLVPVTNPAVLAELQKHVAAR